MSWRVLPVEQYEYCAQITSGLSYGYWYDIEEFDNEVQFHQMYRIPINQAIKKYWMKRELDELTTLFGKMCVCN